MPMSRLDARVRAISHAVLALALVASIVLWAMVQATYSDYVEWTDGARAEVVAASALWMPDGAEIAVEVLFTAPPVRFQTEIESVQFNVRRAGVHYGFYNIPVPVGFVVAPRGEGAHAVLSLYAPIAPENSGGLLVGPPAAMSGYVAMRVHLPHRKQIVRVALEGDLSTAWGVRK
ncbi:MAG TPA: hypothetical protein DCL63_01475 [Firmicutes bacterium]|nr:hypothetical protein [Bacillota bacterium]HBK60484.1 hypothetical protein [Bacillota bacterium]